MDAQTNRFGGETHGGRWFHWGEVEACFWPGLGRRADASNAALAPVRLQGGVYILAASERRPRVVSPAANQVRYIGETGFFKRRMAQFGSSAGFWNGRRKGHSAGWRWNYGPDHLWVCFVPLGNDLLPHLAKGLRCWMEALALEEYRRRYGSLPEVNAKLGPEEEAGA